MTTITCSHPQDQLEVKQQRVRSTDLLLTFSKPKPFCNGCESFLPVFEEPGRTLVTFFFIRQERECRAQLVA